MYNLIRTSLFLSLIGVVGCASQSTASVSNAGAGASGTQGTVTINFGSYSITKDVYEKDIFPAFQTYWKSKTGQDVKFEDSYDASGAESRSIASGLAVDVAALSLEDDLTRIQKAGLITHDWKQDTYKGMVTDSIVSIGVRKGNPKGIHDWSDLAKPGVVVDLPNPQTSGGAKWDINAIYGGGLKTSSPDLAKSLLASIVKNVSVMDKSGEESMTTFTKGMGDAVVSYENEILTSSNNLQSFDEVIPQNTMLIENPVALIDKNVDSHGNRTAAQGFVDFLRSKQAQEIFLKYGFRPITDEVKQEVGNKFTTPPGLFNIDYLGGWDKVNSTLYAQDGIMNQVLAGK